MMTGETDRKNGSKFMELRKKALRRGERLARTLRKMAAGDDPGHAQEHLFLGELERTLERIRNLSDRRSSTKARRKRRGSDLKPGGAAGERLLSSKSKGRRNKQQLASGEAK